MRKISTRVRNILANDPRMKTCERYQTFKDHTCEPDPRTGRLIEWEHVWTYGGKQIDETWAIIGTCWWAHRGPGLDKSKNQFISLHHASDEDLQKYPRMNWAQARKYLISLFGEHD